MRIAILCILSCLLFALVAYPLSSFATSCASVSDFVLGQCSKMGCSKSFQVENRRSGGCGRRTIFGEVDSAALTSFLKSSPMLTETEQLVVFAYGRSQCLENQATCKEGSYSYISQNGQCCYYPYLATTPVNELTKDSGRLSLKIKNQEFQGKTFEELRERFRTLAEKERTNKIVRMIVAPFVLLALIFVPLLWIRKTAFSSLHWSAKTFLLIPPISVHIFLILNLLFSPHEDPLLRVGVPLCVLASYCFFPARSIIRRHLGDQSASPAQ